MVRNLQPDDVVFMYAARDPAVYEEYGTTVVAWGGAHTLERVQLYEELGIHATGTMWCLTAGPKALHEDPDLREATVRDIEGHPIIIPWQIDNVYEGTPTWWGCTNHPTFRAHVRGKVCEAMSGGAQGLHVDDHLGTAHPTRWAGGCFCDYCMAAFRAYLQEHSTPELLQAAGVDTFADFDYRDLVREHATTRDAYLEVQEEIPLHQHFVDCQLQLAAENTRQLGALAEEIVKHPVTLSANTFLPVPEHTVVTPYLTYLVGEMHHKAEEGTAGLLNAVHAYRMAETLGHALAATAAGWDWAYIKEHGSEGLVQVWIALSYACGQRLMAPHRMWCFTPEKGTHWYHGTTEKYAPLYRFVRAHGELFRGTRTIGPLAPPQEAPARFDTLAQRQALEAALAEGDPRPLQAAAGRLWFFPRAREDAAVVHVVNMAYDPETDTVEPQENVEVRLDRSLFDHIYTQATLYSYDADPLSLPLTTEGDVLTLTLPQQRLWSIILLE